ncbi:MAG: hypothetical protein NTX07_08180 [Solirubrobacterales bacterium]|nr:hypothetical protein [Solirubrobacterales bacterium]
MRRALGIASAFLALTAVPASAATLTSNGALSPSFSRGLSNFTTTCNGGSMRLGISVLRSTSVKVGTAAALKGPRTATVKLQPGKRVIVQVTEGGRTSSHSIRCVPSDFPRSSATGMLPADIPMLAINDISSRTRSKTSNTSYAIIVDRHGVPIWWHKENLSLVNFFATPDGSLAIGHASGPLKLPSR